jgi:hypothetical protein
VSYEPFVACTKCGDILIHDLDMFRVGNDILFKVLFAPFLCLIGRLASFFSTYLVRCLFSTHLQLKETKSAAMKASLVITA